MTSKDISDSLTRIKLKEKIFKIQEMYHPRLVSNLSKEAHDRYLIRDSICSQLLNLLDDNSVSMEHIQDYIKKNIKEREMRLADEDNTADFELINMAIKEWKVFYEI